MAAIGSRIVLLALATSALACGSNKDEFIDEPGDDAGGGINIDGSDPDWGLTDGVAPPPCTGLKCKQVKCDPGKTTSISGKVYDPAGKVPLYNVIVYVPNAPLSPLPKGVTCDKCGAITSGSPIVTALTNAKGEFVLNDVPVDKDLPLVMQVGKWRRQVYIPTVNACVDNPVTDKNLTRLPRNQSEGDMPQIGLVTGRCDEMECLLRKIGIDDKEFTDPTGTGKVHFYKGNGGGGYATSPPAQPFWSSLDTLKKYDISILSCECSEYPANKGPVALKAMHDYVEAGGRMFATHYHYYWFKSNADPLWAGIANWTPVASSVPNYLIDMTFPKGKAYGDWLMNVGASTVLGQLPLVPASVRYSLSTITKPAAQRWVYKDAPEAVKYFSVNVPIGKPVEAQCGRAVFSDIHVSAETGGAVFPGGCTGSPDLLPQEKALEFLFFDLSSCIQKDDEVPKPPPVK